jgi:hypothetical protein
MGMRRTAFQNQHARLKPSYELLAQNQLWQKKGSPMKAILSFIILYGDPKGRVGSQSF